MNNFVFFLLFGSLCMIGIIEYISRQYDELALECTLWSLLVIILISGCLAIKGCSKEVLEGCLTFLIPFLLYFVFIVCKKIYR